MIKVKKAHELLSGDAAIRAKVAGEMPSSWPIPLLEQGGLRYLAFYYAVWFQPPSEEGSLYPPTWLSAVDASSGKVLSVQPKDPTFFGINSPRDQSFDKVKYDHPYGPDEMEPKIDEFLETYNVLVERWLKLKPSERSKAAPRDPTIENFLKLFTAFTPAAFFEVYRRLGPDFFAWVDL